MKPRFKVPRPKDKTDEEIIVEIERKVIQAIGNYTHKEWEGTQKILKHQGCMNRVLEEMAISCPPRPILRPWATSCNRQGLLVLKLSRLLRQN
jgi:hypothetical protein